MVIFYDNQTKEILYTENATMTPQLPVGTTEEKVTILQTQGKAFVSVPYEMGIEVFDYNLCFDETGNFTGLQPK